MKLAILERLIHQKTMSKFAHIPKINEKSWKLLKNYSPIHLWYDIELKKKKKTISRLWNWVEEEREVKEKE